jgi:hypothetical protein
VRCYIRVLQHPDSPGNRRERSTAQIDERIYSPEYFLLLRLKHEIKGQPQLAERETASHLAAPFP